MQPLCIATIGADILLATLSLQEHQTACRIRGCWHFWAAWLISILFCTSTKGLWGYMSLIVCQHTPLGCNLVSHVGACWLTGLGFVHT